MKRGSERLTLILSEGEGERIEFKEGLGRLDREIVALSNAGGGSIFVGVNDQGEIFGINVGNRMQSEVSTIARNCDPPLKVETFVYPERFWKYGFQRVLTNRTDAKEASFCGWGQTHKN